MPLLVAAAYAVQIALVTYTVFHASIASDVRLNTLPGTRPIAEWLGSAPIRVDTHEFVRPKAFTAAFVALGLAQSAALFAIYRRIRARGLGAAARACAIAAAAIMSAVSIAAPASTSGDMYAYVGYGLAPSLHASFEPSAYRLPPAFALIGKMYGDPLPPNVYGAGFYAFMAGVAALHLSLTADLFLLRALGAAAFAFAVWLLRERLASPALVTLALCPALYLDWILDGHNDVYPEVLAVAAFVLMRKNAAAAVASVAVAGLFKISLLAVGVSLVAVRDTLAQRVAIAALMAFTFAGAFFALDGPEFAHVLVRSAVAPPAAGSPQGEAVSAGAGPRPAAAKPPAWKIRGLTLLAMLAAIAAAILFARAGAGNAFLFSAIAPLPYAWYLCWGLAYAALGETTFAFFAIALPSITSYVGSDAAHLVNVQYVDWGLALACAGAFAVLRLNGRAGPGRA